MSNNKNLLIIMVDETSACAINCYGNKLVKTPHIDALARSGTLFNNAYASSPICVPARAAFATGQYPHRTRYWDNCFAYDGKVRGWGHRMSETGHRLTTIGKLHYLDDKCDTGIDEQIHAMHIFEGGDVYGLERENPPSRPQSALMADEVKVGDSQYTLYDKKIVDLTDDWFRRLKGVSAEKTWVCFTSFIAPHFPLTVPEKYISQYKIDEILSPDKKLDSSGPLSEWWAKLTFGYNFDEFFRDDVHRRTAIMHYFALCTFADENVGKVVQALEDSGLREETVIMFLSDHGDNMGQRGLWGKSTMYEEACKIPLILSGPGVPQAKVCETPVSLVDGYPTVLDIIGIPFAEEDLELPGKSLLEIAAEPFDPNRTVFSEYHASCAPTGMFMLRRDRFKYIHYTSHGAELFDLVVDPNEKTNLSDKIEYGEVLASFEAEMRSMVDPEIVDKEAKSDQRQRLQELGGMEAILARGGVTHTPPPGEEAVRY